MKERLISAPILAMPVEDGGFILETDANNYLMGYVLQQMQDSKSFSETELRNYTTHRELAAVIYGLKYYRHFLLGFPFVLRTDHAALTHRLRTPNPVAQLARYLDTLAEYQFIIHYQPGLLHHNADALSCRPCNRELNALRCQQCAPMLESMCEDSEEETEDVRDSVEDWEGSDANVVIFLEAVINVDLSVEPISTPLTSELDELELVN